MKKSLLTLVMVAVAVPAVPALADPPPWAPAYGERRHQRHDDYDAYERNRIYDSNGRYLHPRRVNRDSYIWRGRDGRYYCRRDNGTTGLLIGAGVGALAGHEIAGNGDRTHVR